MGKEGGKEVGKEDGVARSRNMERVESEFRPHSAFAEDATFGQFTRTESPLS